MRSDAFGNLAMDEKSYETERICILWAKKPIQRDYEFGEVNLLGKDSLHVQQSFDMSFLVAVKLWYGEAYSFVVGG